jgi:predicted nucleic-acid-binding Zn-ribbon protein
MNVDQFWRIVEDSRKRGDGDLDRQFDALCALLLPLPVDQIVEFQGLLDERMAAACTWDLRAAAWFLGGGQCSDEGFIDFRGWLISMGRTVYESALRDANAVIEATDRPDVTYHFFEEFSRAPAQVYQERTGQPLLHASPEVTIAGQPWAEDDLRARYPRLWARFMEQEQVQTLSGSQRAVAHFLCARCGGRQAEANRFGGEGRGLSNLFGRTFVAVSCRSCGYTDLYDEQLMGK